MRASLSAPPSRLGVIAQDKRFVYILLAIPLIAMILVAGLNFRPIGDEAPYHQKVIARFADDWPTPDISDYPSASTPLPYVMWVAYGEVVGFDLWKLRLVTVLATYLAAVLFYWLAQARHLPYPVLSAVLFLAFPYTYFHGFTIYTVTYGLLFGVLALRYYLADEETLAQWGIAAIFAFLAILSRQYYLALPSGMLLYRLISVRRELITDVLKHFPRWLVLGAPLAAILPLFVLWGGLTPPMHQEDHFLRPAVEHLNFAPIFVAFYFLPGLLNPEVLQLRRRWPIVLVVLLVLLPIFFAAPLRFSDEPNDIGAVTGIIGHGLDIVGQKISPVIEKGIMLVLWATGWVLLLSQVLTRTWTAEKLKLVSMLIAYILLVLMTPYVGERYYMLTVPLLILLFYKSYRYPRVLAAWAAGLMVLAAGFSYWQIVLKSFE